MDLNLAKFFRKSTPVPEVDPLERWRESAAGIDVPSRLRTLGTVVRPRPREDIAQRALIVSGITHVGFGAPRQEMAQWLQEERLWDRTTEWEKSFLTRPDVWPAELNRAGWQIERLWVLAWAMGLVGQLNHEAPCGPNLGALIPRPGSETRRFIAGARCRDELELSLEMETLRGFRQRSLKGPTHESRLTGLIAERYKAMRWVVGSADWDADDTA